MTVAGLAEKLSLTPVVEADPDREVKGGYTGDLLSWVMGRAQADNAWVTIMSNLNVVAVATLTDVALVIFAEGVKPEPEVVAAAEKRGVNLYSSELASYALCGELNGLI